MNWKNIRKIFYVMFPAAILFALIPIPMPWNMLIGAIIGAAGTLFCIKYLGWNPYDDF